MRMTWMGILLAGVCAASAMVACGDDDDGGSDNAAGSSSAGSSGAGGGASGSGGSAGSAAGTAGSGGGGSQTPPQGADAVEAWLKTGDYKSWHCESAVHEARSPSPHGFNRICSNDAIASTADGNWPMGAAAVKELYASATDTAPVGYAVYLKTAADSAGGASWYWYERVPLDSKAPHDDKGVVADGMGTGDTPAKNICVGCHMAAGSDADHTPSPGGRDEVYTPVK